ncbi:MAG: phosphohydrolase [Lachnospiraceae bacterium]|nr:phosphohydrolase [Lachnospiraceae bacterium]
MPDYILTYTKVKFTPTKPVADDVHIEDIAHALSMLCRANGHYSTFYSIGAHCLNCYEEACARRESARVKMACLLHDACEAYISDITRPVKQYLDEYKNIEDRLSQVIYEKFLGSPLTEYEEKMVKLIDDAMLYHEFLEFTGEKLLEEAPYVAATPDFFRGTMRQVEQEYLEVFNSIDLNDNTEVKETIKWIR